MRSIKKVDYAQAKKHTKPFFTDNYENKLQKIK